MQITLALIAIGVIVAIYQDLMRLRTNRPEKGYVMNVSTVPDLPLRPAYPQKQLNAAEQA